MKYILQKKGAAHVGRSQVLTIKHYLQSLKRALSTVSFVDYLLLFISRSSSLRLLFPSWPRRASHVQRWYRRGQTR